MKVHGDSVEKVGYAIFQSYFKNNIKNNSLFFSPMVLYNAITMSINTYNSEQKKPFLQYITASFLIPLFVRSFWHDATSPDVQIT